MHYVGASPGAAKSLVAKATGNTAGIPTIAFDLGAMQNALVGESGGRLRTALKVVDAVTQWAKLVACHMQFDRHVAARAAAALHARHVPLRSAVG
jgi:SpoVK/Ycf46/Vps4 family AAA+-type ATPase